MGFFSFLGRVLFSSLFILSAWQMFNEFGEDGGPAARELTSKVDVLRKHLSANIGTVIPAVDSRRLVPGIIALKGLGGSLFVFGSLFGAYLLLVQLVVTTPVLFDFYNYSRDEAQHFVLLNKFLQWNEEIDPEETTQEEGPKGKARLGVSLELKQQESD